VVEPMRENTFMLLVNPKYEQSLCGEFKYLGSEKYSFLKWHQIERCNGMFCAGKLQDLPQTVLKPIPLPTPKPTSQWNDNGGGGAGWGDK